MGVISAFDLKAHAPLQADICIIGGGAAGIAIAKEFIGTSYQVILLESGGLKVDEKTQSLYDVDNVGHPLRMDKGYVSRNRYFGGSTNTWAGRCMPMNDIDFEVRSWVGDSGWPFGKATLTPFYEQAARLLNLPDYEKYRPDYWQSRVLQAKSGFLFADSVTQPEVSLFSHSPMKMASAYGRELQSAPNIRIYTHANVTEIEPNQALSGIEQLHVSTLDHHRFLVKSKVYILACGGWENARLLLASTRHCQPGLGNQHDTVGRYYMEHPKMVLGRIYPQGNMLKSPIFQDFHRVAGGFVQLGIRLSDQTQRQQQLLNHYIELCPGYPAGMPEAQKAFQWFGSRLKRLRWTEISPETIQTFAPHLNWLSSYALRKRLNRPIPFPYISILNHCEQAPNWDSRVTLSDQRDALGMRRLKVNLKITAQEKASLVRLHELLDRHFQQRGVGKLVSQLPDIDSDWSQLTDSSHHMGTTRMSDHPQRGVVDRDCKLHGFSNLFIASSSVFPTGGHANPTLTLLALALRLAQHLKTTVLPTLPTQLPASLVTQLQGDMAAK